MMGNLDALRSLPRAEVEAFYRETLHAEFLGTVGSSRRLSGVDRDPISGGFGAPVSTYGAMSVQDPAKPILVDGSGRAAAVRVDEGSCRAVYFAFIVSGIGNASDRENLIGAATEWLIEKRIVPGCDIGLERVLAPERYTNKVAVIPSVQVVNLGTRDEHEIPMVCVIERDGQPVYTDRRTVWSLRRGETRPFSFRPWIPGIGVYEFTFYLDLPGDANEANDVLTTATDVGAFLDVSSPVGIEPESASEGRGVAVGDYDGDGDLDVFVACYGGPDRLYRNDRGRLFAEVSSQVGVGLPGKSRAGAWADYDNDGDLDLYVSHQEVANRLYRNEGKGRFTDATMWAGVGHSGAGRAVVWGDYDEDGYLDLFVANADGSGMLYRNLGGGQFIPVSFKKASCAGKGKMDMRTAMTYILVLIVGANTPMSAVWGVQRKVLLEEFTYLN